MNKAPLVSGSIRICCLAAAAAAAAAAAGFNQLCVQSRAQKIGGLEVYKDNLQSEMYPKMLCQKVPSWTGLELEFVLLYDSVCLVPYFILQDEKIHI